MRTYLASRAPAASSCLVGALAVCFLAVQARADEAAESLYNEADLLFIQHMMVHHEQALVMCSWVPERSGRAEFVRFARYVDRAQAAEIQEMQSWLDLAVDRGIAIPEHHLHGDPPMPGMLSTAEMDEIMAANGAQFERLWLEGMIRHHQGAVDMARAQQQQQLASGRQPYELATFVEDLLIEQRAEIVKMRGWLEEWGLSR
jgi:uncharacterized protein (DUF305 family)